MFTLAFDFATNRHMDADGRLHVASSHISKAQVSDYMGQEIPDYDELGLDPNKIYRMLRDPKELQKAAPTFNNLPILSKHVPVTADEPRKDLVIGSLGSDVEFVYPYLDASTCIWYSPEIAAIESDVKREWSCSYRYDADMSPGIFEGNEYDGVMRNIQGNHLALVEAGRAGADVYVADSKPLSMKAPAMKMTKLGKALTVALQAASPKLAADSALPILVGKADKKLNKSEVTKKLVAMDADMSPEKLDAIIDAILDIEESPVAMEPATDVEPGKIDGDEPRDTAQDSGNEKLVEFLKSKGMSEDDISAACGMVGGGSGQGADAYDAEEFEKKAEEKMKGAMDALRAEFRALDKAKQDVRSVVGDVVAMDSAEQVYRFALDHLKVDHKEVKEVSGLRALLSVASDKKTTPRVAHDAAGVLTKFPGLARFA